jgi:hypothetical protein
MDTSTESTIPEFNTEEVRRRNRSEYGKQWRQANKERKKEYQKGWAKQRKLLEANAIRITEEEFIALLEARKSIMDTAREMIAVGFNIESKFCESLFAAAGKMERMLAKRIGIKSWDCMPNDYNSLEWALEYLDKGEPAVITFENQQLVVKIYNYKQLFRTLMEEAEQQRADDRANQPSNGKKKKPAAKEKSKENSVDNTGELFPMFL